MPSTRWELFAKLALGSASRAASPSPVKPVTATTSATSDRTRGRRPFMWAFLSERVDHGGDDTRRVGRLRRRCHRERAPLEPRAKGRQLVAGRRQHAAVQLDHDRRAVVQALFAGRQ